MEALAPPGKGWNEHLPYRVAATYYDEPRSPATYRSHVDNCDYCTTLLESLHPTALDAADFAARAVRLHSHNGNRWPVKIAPYALVASAVFCAFGAWALMRAPLPLPPGAPGRAGMQANSEPEERAAEWVSGALGRQQEGEPGGIRSKSGGIARYS